MPRDPWDERRREWPPGARPSANGNGRRPGGPTRRDRSTRERGGAPARGDGLDRGPLPPRNGGGVGGRGGEPRPEQPGGRRPAGGRAARDGFGGGRGDGGRDHGRVPGAAASGRNPGRDRRPSAGRDERDPRGDGDGAALGRRRARSWPQRAILAAGVVLVLFCMLGASVAGYALVKYNSIDRVDNLDLPSAAKGEPENFLIVAPDIREGHTSFNTDTIMVLRIDPSSDRLALTSFPRDLMVTVADTGETGMINAVYNRPDGTGPENLINTLRQNYSVTINHFVEIRFESFREVVDSVGGVSMWFEAAARDTHSGFYNEDLGCVNLDGERGLEFVRSRYLDIMTEDGWERDPKSDEHRVLRQQIFIQRAMTKVLADVKSNPVRLGELINIGVSNVTLDPNLGFGDIRDLGEHFKDFDPAKLETYPLPT